MHLQTFGKTCFLSIVADGQICVVIYEIHSSRDINLFGFSSVFSFPNCPNRVWGPPSAQLSGYQNSFSVKKRPKRDADHSHTSSVEVNNEWSYTSVPPICLHGVDGNNLLLSYFVLTKSHKNAGCVNDRIIWADRVRSSEGLIPY